MSGAIGVAVSGCVVVGRTVSALMLMARGGFFVSVRVLDQLSFSLNAKFAHRTERASSQRTPDGEQHSEQKQEPDAKRVHSS
jgi:hypothetical protein